MAPFQASDFSPENQELLRGLLAMLPPGTTFKTPPSWTDPNYVPSVNRSNSIIAVAVISTVIPFVAVCLRIYTRATQRNTALGLDDLMIVLGMVRLYYTVHRQSVTET